MDMASVVCACVWMQSKWRALLITAIPGNGIVNESMTLLKLMIRKHSPTSLQ